MVLEGLEDGFNFRKLARATAAMFVKDDCKDEWMYKCDIET